MRETRHNRDKKERGQSAVEFGLVLPIVLMLIFGIIEFGRIANGLLSANHCANELARYAVVGRSEADVIDYALTSSVCPTLDLNLPNAELLVDVNFPAGVGVGSLVVVNVDYPVELIFPGVRNLFDDGIYWATGRATLRMERSFID